MPYLPQSLLFIKGLPSTASLGNTAVTDTVPTTLSLLGAVYSVFDEAGQSSFRPKIATVKQGGVWADSSTLEGRQLEAAKRGNVLEEIRLKAEPGTSATQRLQAQSELAYYAQAAAEYFDNGRIGPPVTLGYWALGAPGPQYALVYTIEVALDGDGLNPLLPSFITLTVERETYWKPLPPGSNPKQYTLEQRGLIPSPLSGGAAAGHYNSGSLSLTAFGGAASYQNLVEATVYSFDESTAPALAAFVNYVTIPAASLPGEGPIPALIVVEPTGGTPAETITNMYLAHTTKRDLFPANTTNAVDQKARDTFNGTDCTLVAPAGMVVSHVIDATNGLRGAADTANRRVLNLAYNAAASITTALVATWERRLNQYAGRFAVFLRYLYVSGTATDLTYSVQFSTSTAGSAINTIVQTPYRAIRNAGSRDYLYLGEIDTAVLAQRQANIAGTGMDIATNLFVQLRTTKLVAAGAAVCKVIDLVLLPLDEAVNFSLYPGVGVPPPSDYAFFDNTGYFRGGDPQAVALKSVGGAGITVVENRGQPILLTPGVDNRIYIMPRRDVANTAASYQVAVNVMPQWLSTRKV